MPKEVVEVPITGKIVSLEAKVGDDVKEGDVLCFIESMKMENPILAPVSGKLTEMNITIGQVVEAGKPLATIEF